MSNTITFSFHNHYGYKAWMAKITGTDSRYGLSRAFCQQDRTSSRSGKTGDVDIEIDAPGVYEVGGTKRNNGFRVVWVKDGKLAWGHIEKSRAVAIARLMDDGENFEDARLATKSAS